MPALVSILDLYTWILIAGIVYALIQIARFYEAKYAELYTNTAGQRTYYRLFLVPLSLFLVAAGRYAFLNDFAGDPFGDIALCAGGIVLGLLVYRLQRLMTGGRR